MVLQLFDCVSVEFKKKKKRLQWEGLHLHPPTPPPPLSKYSCSAKNFLHWSYKTKISFKCNDILLPSVIHSFSVTASSCSGFCDGSRAYPRNTRQEYTLNQSIVRHLAHTLSKHSFTRQHNLSTGMILAGGEKLGISLCGHGTTSHPE